MPDTCIPPVPECVTGRAAEEWQRITAELEANGMVSSLDLAILAAYCTAYGSMVDAVLEWQRNGSPFTTLSVNGMEMIHPLFTVCNQTREQVRKMANEIGLTNSSKSKVIATKKDAPKKNKFAM